MIYNNVNKYKKLQKEDDVWLLASRTKEVRTVGNRADLDG